MSFKMHNFPQEHDLSHIVFCAKHDGHAIYDYAELNSQKPNSLEEV